MTKIKLAVFDLEGTVFKKSYKTHNGEKFESAWGALCSYLGEEATAEDEANRQKFYGKKEKYPYSNWVLDTIKIYKKYGLKKSCFDNMINSVDYFDGATETFSHLKRQGVATAVISGGLKALADRVALDHRVEHSFTAAEFYWFPKGNLQHWNIIPTDFSHKKTILGMLLQELSLDKSQVAFIGDGINDVDIASHAEVSIAFNSKYEELKAVSRFIVDQEKGKESLNAVLDFIQ